MSGNPGLAPPSSSPNPPPLSPSVKRALPTGVGDNEYWYRLGSLVFDAILPAFISVFHNDNKDPSYVGLPRRPDDLYNELNGHQGKLKTLVRKKVINQHQYDLVLPASQTTDTRSFDVTLVVVLIRNFLQLPPSSSPNWNVNQLDPQDNSIIANIIRGKQLRNYLCHNDPSTIDYAMFKKLWAEGEEVVKRLQYQCDTQSLLTAPLDGKTAIIEAMLCKVEKDIKKVESRLDITEEKANDAYRLARETIDRLDNLENKDFYKGIKCEQEEPYIQWKLENGYCYVLKFDEGSEKIEEETLQRCNKQEWENVDVDNGDVEKDVVPFPSLRFVKFTGLAKRTNYRVQIKIKRDTGARNIETKEFEIPGPGRVTHCSQSHGLQVLVHNDGGFANIFSSEFQLHRDPKPIEVFVGAGKVNKITSFNDWLKYCESNFGQFSSTTTKYCESLGDWENLVMKNWKRSYSLTNHVDVQSEGYSQSWKECFIAFIKSYFSKGVFVFDNYDIVEHFEFLGYRYNIIKDELDLLEYRDGKFVFIFVPSQRMLLMVAIVDIILEDQCSLFTIQSELQYLINDIKIFTAFHQDFLTKGNITVIPLLGLTNITKTELDKTIENHNASPICKDCRRFMLCKDFFTNDDDTDVFWRAITGEIRRESMLDRCHTFSEEIQNIHERFLAHIIGYMATTDMPCLTGVYDKEAKCIRKISLSRIQNDLLSLHDKHLFIRGGYGSGKSVVCQLKLYHLVETIKGKGKIFFLCHDTKTKLSNHMKDMTTQLMNKIQADKKDVEIIAGDFVELAQRFNCESIELNTFLELISKEYGNHLILDEYNALDLTKEKAIAMREILERPTLKESFVWIAVRPLLKYRSKSFERKITLNVPIYNGYEFECTGVKIQSLDRSFRNTKCIHDILKETKKCIENINSKFFYREENVSVPPFEKISESDEVSSDIHYPRSHEEKAFTIESPTNENDKPTVSNPIYDNVHFKSKRTPLESANTKRESYTKRHSKHHLFDSMDQMFRFYENEESNSQAISQTIIETSFQIYGNTQHCCNIEGEKPILVSPFHNNSDAVINFEMIIRIYIALKDVIRLQKSVAIICTDVYEALICIEAVKLLKERHYVDHYTCYMPTLHLEDSQELDYCLNGKNVMITDTEGVTGLEFEKVIVTVTPTEYFLSHTLVRSLSRCQSELFFLQFPHLNACTEQRPARTSTGEIIDVWKKKQLVRECSLIMVSECSCCESERREMYKWQKESIDDNRFTYLICIHQEFRDLEKNYDKSFCRIKEEWKKEERNLYSKDNGNMINMMHDLLKEKIRTLSADEALPFIEEPLDPNLDEVICDEVVFARAMTLDNFAPPVNRMKAMAIDEEDGPRDPKNLHLFYSAQKAPKPKKIICTSVFPMKPRYYDGEYHGPITRNAATQLVLGEDEGAYLVRDSQSKPGSYSLTLRHDNSPKQYQLYYDATQRMHYIGDKYFQTMHELVEDALIVLHMEVHEATYIRRMTVSRKEDVAKATNVTVPTGEQPEKVSSPSYDWKFFKPLECEKCHDFKIDTYYKPQWCKYCDNFLYGLKRQGMTCRDCNYKAHIQCSQLVPPDCIPHRKHIKRVFGTDLTRLIKAYNRNRPEVVDKCISEIETRGMDEKLLYEANDNVDRLKKQIDRDCVVPDMSWFDISTISSLLKLYLRDLPEPLITFNTFDNFISLAKSNDEREAVRSLPKTVKSLPPAHIETLRYIFGHLQRVLKSQDTNLMTLEKIGTAFAELLLRVPDELLMDAPKYLPYQSRIIQLILANCNSVFGSENVFVLGEN